MKKTVVFLFLVLALALLVIGCAKNNYGPTGYDAYPQQNPQPQQQQQQYYGGGCGVAPADVGDAPAQQVVVPASL